MIPYYCDDDVVIYHGDCREFLGDFEAACVVTSPPYNSGMPYDVHVDDMHHEDYAELAMDSGVLLADAVVSSGGRVWVNVGVEVMPLWMFALGVAGFAGLSTVCWDYGMPTSDTAWGSWQSPVAPHLRYSWEPVICAWLDRWARTPPGGLESWRDELGRWPDLCRNVWRVRPACGRGEHPAVMPAEIAERAIRLSTWPGETVLDPFMGSGTTLVAARLLGRRAVGIEVSERYCELAARRLAQGTLDFEGVLLQLLAQEPGEDQP